MILLRQGYGSPINFYRSCAHNFNILASVYLFRKTLRQITFILDFHRLKIS